MGTQPLTMVLTGDSMIMRRVSRSGDPRTRQLIACIRDADVAFTNLEVLPNDFRGHPAQETGGDHMAAHSWVIDDLIEMGFDLFATAHNHTLDYSIEGMLATMEILDRKGVTYAGMGRKLGEARMPVYYDSPAGAVALIACCSTFTKGQQAGEQRPDMQGRPGLNPLRFSTTYQVTRRHMDMIQEVAHELGMEQQRQESIKLGFSFPPDDPEAFPLRDLTFQVGDTAATIRKLDQRDLDAHTAWVRDARMRAACVVVSVHAHEQGATKEKPADFIPIFARQMIDAGADVVVGHGPHLLRGMEIYRDKPIFYSLGNFIDQHDLIYKHPADAYEKFRLDPAATSAEMARSRNQDDTGGFAADPRYWQTVMPVCSFERGQIVGIEVVPVSLGYGEPVHMRGIPRIAKEPEASEILGRFAQMSEQFGTRMKIAGERASIDIATA